MLHISIKAEEIFEFFHFPITNSLLSTLVLIGIFLMLSLFYTYTPIKNKFNFFITYILNSLYSMFESVNYEKINDLFPLLSSLFFFIILSNWFGLFPGVGSIIIEHGHEHTPILRAATADLNTTIVLAAIAVISIQYYGIKYLGLKEYSSKFLNLTNPILFALGILELFSEFSRVLSFAFRLFGNVFAGEVLIAVIAFLIPVLASFPFLMLEIFVGFIQALVFTMLTSVFLSMATAKSEH